MVEVYMTQKIFQLKQVYQCPLGVLVTHPWSPTECVTTGGDASTFATSSVSGPRPLVLCRPRVYGPCDRAVSGGSTCPTSRPVVPRDP